MAVRLEYSTTARCKPEHAWRKFERLEEWAWWNPVIGQARWLQGERWQKDGRFLFQLTKPRVTTFRPVIIESAVPHRIAWMGKVPGFKGEHWFSFEEQGDGATLLKTWEVFSGVASIFLGQGTRQKIVSMYRDWVEALRAEAEKIAREEYAQL